MSRQLIFCVESDNQAKVDWIYISETIKKYFCCENDIILYPVYMGGKTRYNNQKVRNEIKRRTKASVGETIVFICVDTDSIENDPERLREFCSVKEFCDSHQYELIWFHRDIEEVYIGKKVANSDKKSEAKKFSANKDIENVRKNSLMSTNENAQKSSNIILVLQRYLDLKQADD